MRRGGDADARSEVLVFLSGVRAGDGTEGGKGEKGKIGWMRRPDWGWPLSGWMDGELVPRESSGSRGDPG